MLDLLSVGAIKLDTFIVLPEASVMCELKTPECKLCIEYGHKIPVAAFVTQIAGSAPNVAVGLARMGLKTGILSTMGDDPAFKQATDFLRREKVSTTHLKKQKGFHSSAAVVLNFKGESTQLVDHVPHTYRLPANLPKCQYLYISELGGKYEPLYRDAIAAAKRGVSVGFNPGSVQIAQRKKVFFDLLKVTDVLFLNMSEARRVLKIENNGEIHHLLAKLKALGPNYVVVTDGAQGAYAYDGVKMHATKAFPGKLIEATGAGDSFATGFLGALLKGHTHAEALRWAAVNASSVIHHVGPTKGLLSHTEILHRLKTKPSFVAKEL